MKAQLTQMLQHLHGQTRQQQLTTQLKRLEGDNLQLERSLKEKERQVDQLKQQLVNCEARLQELKGTDELTGLPNRHVFKEHLTHSMKRAVRLGYSLSLMMVDIDHLREINLRYGHEIGDEVLVEVAKIIRHSVREIDVPARWGGEELVTVLHETDAEAAAVVAERVRKRVCQMEVKDPRNGKLIAVSATLAVASYPKHGNEPQALLEAVGDALIVAKERGGNITVVAGR